MGLSDPVECLAFNEHKHLLGVGSGERVIVCRAWSQSKLISGMIFKIFSNHASQVSQRKS